MKKFIFFILTFIILSCALKKKPNVILISIDNLSPEYIEKMENLKSFFQDFTKFENVFTPYPLCLPSHLSILTSKNPSKIGVFLNEYYFLKKEIKTLPGVLKENGYKTIGFISSKPLKKIYGTNNGFDEYDDLLLRRISSNLLFSIKNERNIYLNYRKAEDTLKLAENYIKNEKKPFFLFVHLYDAYPPFLPPEEFLKKYKDPYLSSLFYIDFELGKFLKEIKNEKIYENSIILITSDHGKIEKEEDAGMEIKVKDLKVPLFVKLEKGKKFNPNENKKTISIESIPNIILKNLGIKDDNFKEKNEIFAFTTIPFHYYGKSSKYSLIEGNLKFEYGDLIKAFKIEDLDEKNEILENFKGEEIKEKIEEEFNPIMQRFNLKEREDFYPLILKAQDALKRNDTKGALKILNDFYKTHFNSYIFLKTLFLEKKQENDPKELEKILDIFKENFGESPELEMENFSLLLALWEREKAKNYLFDLMKKYYPFSFFIQEAFFLEEIKDRDEFERFIKKIPEPVEKYISLTFKGILNLFDKKEEEALSSFKEAIEEGSEIPIPYFQAGLILKRKGDVESSIPYFYSSYILAPTNPRYLYELADSYAILGDYEKAYNFFKKSYELNPSNFSTILSYFKISFFLGKKEEANYLKEILLQNYKRQLFDLIERDKLLEEIISKIP